MTLAALFLLGLFISLRSGESEGGGEWLGVRIPLRWAKQARSEATTKGVVDEARGKCVRCSSSCRSVTCSPSPCSSDDSDAILLRRWAEDCRCGGILVLLDFEFPSPPPANLRRGGRDWGVKGWQSGLCPGPCPSPCPGPCPSPCPGPCPNSAMSSEWGEKRSDEQKVV